MIQQIEARNIVIREALKTQYPERDVFIREYPFGCVWQWQPASCSHCITSITKIGKCLDEWKECLREIQKVRVSFDNGKVIITSTK